MKNRNQKRSTLRDLVSVGPATLRDFAMLGIKTVASLAKQDARVLYLKLCKLTGSLQDPCVEDVFAAAIAQAKDPKLPEEKKQWYYWSGIRKERPVRCAWVYPGNALYEEYHDKEWGVPVHDDRKHFEFLILEGAQAGLNWLTILKRRDEYAKAFDDYDWMSVARYVEKDKNRLLQESGIIRNRAKIEAAIGNAKNFQEVIEECGSFDKYIWSFVGGKTLQMYRKKIKDIPPYSDEALLLSKDLMKRGFRFVGPSIMYAHMQATGLVNDHTVDCFRFKECKDCDAGIARS